MDGTLSRRHGQERLRYQVLEHVYLRTGEDCEKPVGVEELEEELGLPRLQMIEAISHLTYRCSYLQHALRGGVCITPAGLEYIQSQAGMRRSVRG